MAKLRMGILGAGRIAAKMADTVAGMDSAVVQAVASRDPERARTFAAAHGVARHFSSYRELLADPEVELVYVATPNHLHHEHIQLCLESGKPVLCEKPFTMNVRQAEEAIRLSQARGLLLAEAIWTRYLPICATLREIMGRGVIGEPTGLAASLGNNVQDWPRIYDPALGGGALMDLGVYLLNFAALLFGTEVESLAADCVKHRLGLDLQTSLTLRYRSGVLAVLHASVQSVTSRRAVVCGSRGCLEVDNFTNPRFIQAFSPDREPGEIFHRPPQLTGFEYQVEAVRRALRAGAIECPEMPHAEILRLMGLLDRFRAKLGIPYPWDVAGHG